MYFKRKQLAFGLGLAVEGDEEITFNYNSGLNVEVVLRSPREGETEQKSPGEPLVCETTCQHSPKDPVLEMFESLAQDRMPEGSSWEGDLPISIVDREGNIQPNHVVPMRWMPESFRSYAEFISNELSEHSEQTVHTLRWRIGARGPHSILRGLGFEYSLDQKKWNPLPRTGMGYVEGKAQVKLTDEQRQGIQGMVQQNIGEPIGHLLWHEAWHQRHENSRSAIVIGIAAAEAAIKRFVAEHVPETEWLMENAPSPPIVKMYDMYLPQLLKNLGIDPGEKTQTAEKLEVLEKGVALRNRIVHVGDRVPSYDTVEEILIAVVDLLWMLDTFDGHEWAESQIGALAKDIGRAI